jgi:hypothetical protein
VYWSLDNAHRRVEEKDGEGGRFDKPANVSPRTTREIGPINMHAIVQTQATPAFPSLPARNSQQRSRDDFPHSSASPGPRARAPHVTFRTTRSVDLGHVDGGLARQHVSISKQTSTRGEAPSHSPGSRLRPRRATAR